MITRKCDEKDAPTTEVKEKQKQNNIRFKIVQTNVVNIIRN